LAGRAPRVGGRAALLKLRRYHGPIPSPITTKGLFFVVLFFVFLWQLTVLFQVHAIQRFFGPSHIFISVFGLFTAPEGADGRNSEEDAGGKEYPCRLQRTAYSPGKTAVSDVRECRVRANISSATARALRAGPPEDVFWFMRHISLLRKTAALPLSSHTA